MSLDGATRYGAASVPLKAARRSGESYIRKAKNFLPRFPRRIRNLAGDRGATTALERHSLYSRAPRRIAGAQIPAASKRA